MSTRTEIRASFLRLARHSDVAAPICISVANGRFCESTELRRICTNAGISQSRAGEVEAFLLAASELGLFKRASHLLWCPALTAHHRDLAPLFEGASLYMAEVHEDRDEVKVVLTKPPSPSRFSDALNALTGDWGLEDTKEALPGIAESARMRFCVMTPFIDDIGAPLLLNLFSRVPEGVSRVLISRADGNDGPPAALREVLGELRALSVQMLSFRVERGHCLGSEMSHAKVVLADDHTAYVGSLNMTRWSLEYSLELGVRVAGRSAKLISNVVDAAQSVSFPMRVLS